MKHLVDAVRQSIQTGNWYSALTLSLTLPDIAAKIDGTFGRGVGERYAGWWDKYLTPRYSASMSRGLHVFLGGKDAYALRCAFLHEGEFDISGQKAKQMLDRFHFVMPANGVLHCCQSNAALALQVNIFCEDICQAVIAWMSDISNNSASMLRLEVLPKIHFSGLSF